MTPFGREDSSVLGRWWWEVDRYALGGLLLLAAVSILLMNSASPSVAERIGVDSLHFIRKHTLLIGPALAVMFLVSLLSPRHVRRLAALLLGLSLLLLLLTPFTGAEVKGAVRWISIAGVSVQPSEFAKPAFAVVAAALFAASRLGERIPGYALAAGLYAVLAFLIIRQPDVSQAVILTLVWLSQFFLSGIPLVLVPLLAALIVSGIIVSYLLFPHVQQRVDGFLNPGSVDSYQLDRAADAFANGGVWGVGLGNGAEKIHLPDSHTDFILAVAAEEFGLVFCLLLIGLYVFILLRCAFRAAASGDLFIMLATTGLLTQFAAQALVNMASTLSLIPTTGMTLPFISYGGSSLLSLSLGMGMLLALTRTGRRTAP